MASHSNNSGSDGQDKYNIFMGLLEPELKKLAEWLRSFAPHINSQALRRIIGIINAFVNSKANNVQPLAGALLTQITKIIDDVFLDEPSHDSHEPEAVKIVTEEWITALFNESGERIKNAADKEAEYKNIKKEFELRFKLLKLMQETQQKHEEKRKAAAPTPHTSEPIEIGKIAAMTWQPLKWSAVIYAGIALVALGLFLGWWWLGLSILAGGVLFESNWTIFMGGMILLCGFAVIGIVLFPLTLLVRFFRGMFAQGGHSATSTVLVGDGHTGVHGDPHHAKH